jgi:hypothetical protein
LGLRAMPRGRRTMFSNFGVRLRGVGGCSATRARRRRRRARSAALHGLGGSRLSCSTAMRPVLSSEPPVWPHFQTISHTDDRPPLVRKTPDGPETRPDGWFRRAKGGGRPSQVLCGPAGPNLAVIHQPTEAPHATPELSRWCKARCPTGHFEQAPSKPIAAHRMWRGVGNCFETQIIKSGQFLILGLSIWRDRPSINPTIFASFPLASFPTVYCRVCFMARGAAL